MQINRFLYTKTHLLIIALIVMPTLASAQSTFNPQGFMNKMLNDLMGSTSTWHTIFVPAATSIFLFLSATEFSFDTGVRLLRGGESGKMLGFAVLRLLTVGLFLYFVENVDWVYQIIAQYRDWAAQAGGVEVGYGPSEVAGIGVDIASDFFSAVTLNFTDVLKDPRLVILGITTVFAGFCIMAAFGWAALQLFCIYVEFFMVVNAGVINLGFLGSSWTRDMGKKYFNYIIAVGTKLLIALLIVAAVKAETATWASQVLINKSDFNSMLNVMTMLMVDSLMVAVLVSNIPAYAAGVISGVSSGSANQALTAGMGTGGGAAMAGAAAMGGAYMLYGAGKGAMGAVSDAIHNKVRREMPAPGPSVPSPGSAEPSDGGGATASGNSTEAQAGIGSGTGGTNGNGNGTGNASKPNAFQRGMRMLDGSKNIGSNANQHWSNAQSTHNVSPPDLRDKDLGL